MCHLMLSFSNKSAITVGSCFQAISRRFWWGFRFVLLVGFCTRRRPWPNTLKTANIIVQARIVYFQAISRRFWRGLRFWVFGLRFALLWLASGQDFQNTLCYLVPDHQEVFKYILEFAMLIYTTTRQTRHCICCMEIITNRVASFRARFSKYSLSGSLVFLDLEQIQIEKTEFSCAALKTIVLRTR